MLFGTAVIIGLPAPANAQEIAYPSNAIAHPGEIVYGRDVPYGAGTRRFTQGEAATVKPDSSVLIGNLLSIGLSPLSDADHAAVSAPLTRMTGMIEGAIDVGVAPLTKSVGNPDFVRSEGGSSVSGGAISQGLSGLSSALSALRGALGSGQ